MNREGSSSIDKEREPLLDGKASPQTLDEKERPVNNSVTEEAVSKSNTQSPLAKLMELLPFLGVFAPLVVFWAIFYQQNSTWILQGAQMNCHLGKIQVPPGGSCNVHVHTCNY